MADDTIYVYMALYHSQPDAWQDWDAVKDLHSAGVVESYDAAIVTKEDDGKVHVSKVEKTTRKRVRADRRRRGGRRRRPLPAGADRLSGRRRSHRRADRPRVERHVA